MNSSLPTGSVLKFPQPDPHLSFDPLIKISSFTCMLDVIPVELDLYFDDLEELCNVPAIREDKDGDAFCPAVFDPPHRRKSNAKECSVLAFDFDSLPFHVTGSDLIKVVKEYRCFCYSTFSHQASGKGNRYRLVVAVDSPIPATKYGSVATVLGYRFETLGIEIDASCTKAEQMLFLPACTDDRKDLFEFYTNQGCPLDWEELLATSTMNKTTKLVVARNGIDLIFQEDRKSELFTIAVSKRKAGLDIDQIFDELVHENDRHCQPPLSKEEVEEIATYAVSTVSVINPNSEEKLTQVTMAWTIANNFTGQLCWIKETETWKIFDSQTKLWGTQDCNQIMRIVREELASKKKALAASIRETGIGDWNILRQIQAAENFTFLSGTAKVLRTEANIEKSISIFDASPLIAGLQGGQCIDLKTNTVREIRGSDFLTKTLGVGYDPQADCPLWKKSILEWSCGDQTQVDFLQQWAGYCLSGLTNFHGLLFLFGGGRNGKSVFINILSSLLGDYSRAMNSETLMQQQRGNSATGDIARLLGARFVTAPEMPEGRVFDENLIKQMTGGDRLTARHLYQSDFEFKSTFKLLISGNHKPIVKGSDFGFWRRVHLVPFEANITNPDLHLTDKLLEELPGILNWCIEGWRQCNQGHFVIPQTIKKHSEDYRGEMDLVQQWKDDRLQILSGAQIKAMDGYQSFKAWQIDNGHHPMTANSFYRKVKSHLGTALKKSDGNYYLGYRIKP